LSRCYECGVGTAVDDGLALDWLEKAAEADHPQGCAALANRYARGIGVDKDQFRAEELKKKAVDLGFTPPQVTFKP
jgi:TPR repeat protein